MYRSGVLDQILVNDGSNFRVINGLDVISHVTNDGNIYAHEIDLD